MKKKIAIMLSALLTVALFTVGAIIVGADASEPTLEIKGHALSLSDSIYIKYYVRSSVDGVELIVEGVDDPITYSYTEMIDNEKYYVFDYKGLAAKNMADYVYAKAHVKVGGKDYYSEVDKYSILEYAYTKLGKIGNSPTSDEKLKALLKGVLDYGGLAQTYLGYNTDRLANDDWYQVKIVGGTLADGFDSGLYLTGDKVKITAPATDKDGNAFKCWTNKAGTSVSTSASCELTVGNQNEVYTPTYSTAPATKTYTVKFVDHDGTTLKTETVESGKSATAPSDPTRDGHTFTGWDKKFDNVTADMTVTALYEEITGPTIVVGNATGAPGDEIEIVVSCKNLPKLYALGLIISYDETILKPISEPSEVNCLESKDFQYSEPHHIKNGCRFAWDSQKPATVDGTILKLKFKIKSDASSGTYSISIKSEDTYDANCETINFVFSGKIIVTN